MHKFNCTNFVEFIFSCLIREVQPNLNQSEIIGSRLFQIQNIKKNKVQFCLIILLKRSFPTFPLLLASDALGETGLVCVCVRE